MTSPLTAYLVAMMRTPTDALCRADVDKLAAKYGIRVDWAQYYLNDWVEKIG